MPELPEVETVKRALETLLKGESFRKVEIKTPALRYPLSPQLAVDILNTPIEAIERRAKYLMIFFKNQRVLVLHLGMSGSFKKSNSSLPPQLHDHVIFFTHSGMELRYHDPRRFGMLLLLQKNELIDFFKNLGREPLSPPLTGEELYTLFKNKKGPIKNILLNQGLIVGIGNIYAAEILYEAKISPFKKASTLTLKHCDQLAIAIKEVLTKAINLGGSTLKDYRQVNGTQGSFQSIFKVYNKAGKACITCSWLIEKAVQAGRTTFYCKNCQGEGE